MSVTLVAALIIMILLMVFSVIILMGLTAAAGIRIRTDMVKLVNTYDKIIEGKSKEVNRIAQEIEGLERRKVTGRVEKPTEIIVASPPVGKASVLRKVQYRTKNFRRGYTSIRDSFKIDADAQAALVQVVQKSESGNLHRGNAAEKLRNALSFDTVFQLSQLENSTQLDILSNTLTGEDKRLLENFLEELREEAFDICGFYDWLKERMYLEGDSVTIRSAQYTTRENGKVYCGEICEGIQIIVGNRLFDYSIKEREIS